MKPHACVYRSSWRRQLCRRAALRSAETGDAKLKVHSASQAREGRELDGRGLVGRTFRPKKKIAPRFARGGSVGRDGPTRIFSRRATAEGRSVGWCKQYHNAQVESFPRYDLGMGELSLLGEFIIF